MGIVRVPYPNALPTVVGDYQAQNNLLYAAFLYAQHPVPVVAGNIVKGAVFNVGGTVYQATADTAIGGGASAYVKITPAGAAATADYVANLAGVAWNDTYAGYYDGAGNLYLFDEAVAISSGALAAGARKQAVNKTVGAYILITAMGLTTLPVIAGDTYVKLNNAGGAATLDISAGAAYPGVRLTISEAHANGVTIDTGEPATAALGIGTATFMWDGVYWARVGAANEKAVITASGNWTVPSGVFKIKVTVTGGGGGGGGSGTANMGAGGGGGGGTAIKWLDVLPGAVYAVVVGAGGAGGAAGNNPGSDGGNSSFNVTVVGGYGSGASAIGASLSARAGDGGAASGGDLNRGGSSGTSGGLAGVAGGPGGASFMGGGGRGGSVITAGVGSGGANGKLYGGGGGGARYGSGNYAGGDGAVGVVIVEW